MPRSLQIAWFAIMAVGMSPVVFAQVDRQPKLANLPSPRVVDERRAESAGIRKLVGKHLVLYTDVPSSPAIDGLPVLFDLAVPQWAEYFGVSSDRYQNWQAQGFLIRDRDKFEALGLMPGVNDDFPNGISLGREFWLYVQPSDYYTRHLLLHEGTHVFMLSFLGGCGPGWYMEGMAELFGTHKYDDRYKQLTLRVMPQSRDDVPMWGRIRLIEETPNRRQPLATVLEFDNSRKMGDDKYAWCWALAKFLDTHPRYRARFQKLQNSVLSPDFNQRFRDTYRGQWAELQAEWLAYIGTLDYGYDVERMAIDFRRGRPLRRSAHWDLQTDRGWQSSGVHVEAGKSYRISAKGRYQIAHDGEAWPCEPGGVTLEYHEGRPLGMLLAAIDGNETGATLAEPIPIGLGATITPASSGTLYFRVNDSAAKLHDNRGTVSIDIEPAR